MSSSGIQHYFSARASTVSEQRAPLSDTRSSARAGWNNGTWSIEQESEWKYIIDSEIRRFLKRGPTPGLDRSDLESAANLALAKVLKTGNNGAAYLRVAVRNALLNELYRPYSERRHGVCQFSKEMVRTLAQEHRDTSDLLQSLTTGERDCIDLVYGSGYSRSESARILGVDILAVNLNITSARIKLQRKSSVREKARRSIKKRHAVTSLPSREAIIEALSALTPRQREVFILTQMDGMTQKQAARELGCAGPSVISNLRTAVTKIQMILGDGSAVSVNQPAPVGLGGVG